MIPKAVNCRRCGTFTGQHKMVSDDATEPTGVHVFLEDCVEELGKQVREMQARLNAAGQAAAKMLSRHGRKHGQTRRTHLRSV